VFTLQVVSQTPCQLGEGPLWDPPTSRLLWLDSYQPRLFLREPSGLIECFALPAMAGSLAVVTDSVVLVALQSGIHAFDLRTSTLTYLVDPEPDRPDTRLNDGKVDRNGQFVFGSMGIKERTRGLGSLYRFNGEGKLEQLEEDIIVSNGPAFSPDGRTFYFTDGRRRILAYDYDPDGALSNKRVFFDTGALNTASDGCTVDAEGNVWAALIGSGEILCVDPDGRLKLRLKMPISLPSSVNFGGDRLAALFVTSIRNSGNRTNGHPLSGHVFALEGLDAIGLAEPRYVTRACPELDALI